MRKKKTQKNRLFVTNHKILRVKFAVSLTIETGIVDDTLSYVIRQCLSVLCTLHNIPYFVRDI